jgi:wyosine [tRNA(Phe)-imidazoG37] synthetase (radical SAM superfamily)
LMSELGEVLDLAASGDLFSEPGFQRLPPDLRRVNDIAFSGDGEPTLSAAFPASVQRVVNLKKQRGLDDVKIVLITNAGLFDEPAVRSALDVLIKGGGEIWAKLDAGTDEGLRRINRCAISLERIVGGITEVAKKYPIVIQSLWCRLDGVSPSSAETGAWLEILRGIVREGGRIRLVQVYSTARATAEASVSPLPDDELAAIAHRVETELGVPVEVFLSKA